MDMSSLSAAAIPPPLAAMPLASATLHASNLYSAEKPVRSSGPLCAIRSSFCAFIYTFGAIRMMNPFITMLAFLHVRRKRVDAYAMFVLLQADADATQAVVSLKSMSCSSSSCWLCGGERLFSHSSMRLLAVRLRLPGDSLLTTVGRSSSNRVGDKRVDSGRDPDRDEVSMVMDAFFLLFVHVI